MKLFSLRIIALTSFMIVGLTVAANGTLDEGLYNAGLAWGGLSVIVIGIAASVQVFSKK